MDKRKQGKASREKGKRRELELVHILRDQYGYNVRRGYVFQHEPDVIGLEGIHIEVKAVERLNVREAFKQSVDDAAKRNDGEATLFHVKNRDGWLVTISLETFMDMYGAWIR